MSASTPRASFRTLRQRIEVIGAQLLPQAEVDVPDEHDGHSILRLFNGGRVSVCVRRLRPHKYWLSIEFCQGLFLSRSFFENHLSVTPLL